MAGQLKFELTNQDSAGGKNFTVLSQCTVYVNRKGIFLLEMTLNILEKVFEFPKPISDYKT